MQQGRSAWEKPGRTDGSVSKHMDTDIILTETDGPLLLSDNQSVTVVD